MLFIHLSSVCDVCLQSYTEDNVEKSPHTIPCGHIFCKECLARLASDHTGNRGPCPICRHPYQLNCIKKLHVDVAEPRDAEIANGFLKRMVVACWADDSELSQVVAEVDGWLSGKEASEEDEFEALRKMRKLVAQRQKLLLKKTEYSTTIHSLTETLQKTQDSAIEDSELSQAKELSLVTSVNQLERQLAQSQAEVQLLRSQLASLGSVPSTTEQNGRAERRSKGKDKGKERATFPSPPETPGPLNAGTQRNPLPRPPAVVEYNPAFDPLRHYPYSSGTSHHPIPGPSRIHEAEQSYPVVVGQSPTAQNQIVHLAAAQNPPYQPTPSPPRRNVIVPGPSEQDINELRRSVEALNIGKKPTEERRRKPKEKHRDRWGREVMTREEIRDVTGLGLIDENVPEFGPSDANRHNATYREGYQEGYHNAFEIRSAQDTAANASTTTIVQHRPLSQLERANTTVSINGNSANAPSAVMPAYIQQMMKESIPVRSRPLADRQSIASDAADSTGTWHDEENQGAVRRRSMDSDILQRLTDFPNISPVVERRTSIASSISSNGFHNAFLPVHPTVTDTAPMPSTSNVRRSGTSSSRAAAAPTGSASTSIGFYSTETPRPQHYIADPASASTSRGHSTRESSRRRPHPTRHATQPLSTVTESASSRSIRSLTQSVATPRHSHPTPLLGTELTDDPPSGLGNALGLDLSQDLGSESQQAFAQANATIIAPTPRATSHHQDFLRSYSSGL
uniref:RING-type domain-containing protein n=1 Tax=Moniliophthora roreri TaxID=221103 RepID=A0A0W0EXY8_MONRR